VGPLERWVGWKIPLAQHWICPTYHPSYLLRTKSSLLDRLFSEHLERAFAIDKSPPAEKDFTQRIQLLWEEKEIVEAIRSFEEKRGWVAIDYETNCLKPEYEKAQIVCCSLSNGKRTVAYPWAGRAIEATGKFLASDQTWKIASNLKFEERWTRKAFRHGVTNWGWDTMLAAHCLDNRQHICSLKLQALVNMGIPSYNERIEPYLTNYRGTHYNRIQEIALKDLLYYNGMDSILEYYLARIQRRQMGYQDEE
jgi:hypothetical protein